MIQKIFLSLFTLFIFSGCTHSPAVPLGTVAHVDLSRYSGKWIEIARYENRFEVGCVGATAQYESVGDHIRVTNSCYDAKGEKTGEAMGRAYAIKDSGNSKLEVSFFRPFYGDYWVVMLGEDYQYSVIGDPSRKYLWILSRTQELREEDKKTILAFLPTIGYDPSKLYWTTVRP